VHELLKSSCQCIEAVIYNIRYD